MTSRLFTSAAWAGLVTGIIAALLTILLVVPLILQGEVFEAGAHAHDLGTVQHDHPDAAPGATAAGLWGRHAQTFAMSLVTYLGFALLLVAGFALAARRGVRIDTRAGLLWGIAGFLAVQLAPAAGLPPELPGTGAADLASRQVWWVATVIASAAGIALIVTARGLASVLAGAALLALPHVVGAPAPDSFAGTAPPELAAQFVARALAVSAACWAVLGATAGWFWSRGS